MQTVIDEGVAFEVAWSGSTGWTDPAIACGKALNTLPFLPPPPAEYRALEPEAQKTQAAQQARESTRSWKISPERLRAEALLATRDVWKTAELEAAVGGLTHRQFKSMLGNMSNSMLTEHPRRGWVRLRRPQQQPEAA